MGLVPMSPKGNQHEVVKRALLDHWIRSRPAEIHIAPETTVRLSEDTYLEPDVVIYPRTTGIRGLGASNVLLVVEIADSSLRYDIGRKYETFRAKLGFQQPEGKAGRAAIRVLGDDGKVLHEIADARGDQPPVDLDINVAGVSRHMNTR